MPMSYLPPWQVDYSYDISPNVERSSLRGKVTQSKKGHRRIMRASVNRLLRYSEIPYFEYFIREVNNDGAGKFTDTYQDENGTVTSGEIRIVDGAYDVVFDGRNARVSCQIEVFR